MSSQTLNTTVRKSLRLISGGYYDSKGKPRISYKETRLSKRRRSRSRSESEERDRDSIWNDADRNDTDRDQTHRRNSNRTRTDSNPQTNQQTNGTLNNSDRSRNRLYSILFNHKTFCLFLILRLCFGLAFLTPTFDVFKRLYSGKCQDFLRQLVTPEGDRLPNFALESLGAGIIYERSSQSYYTQETRLRFLGMPIPQPPLSHKTVLQGHSPLTPGVCWPFAGDRGHLTISLYNQVTISHVTLGHIPKHLSPTATIPSAPKDFSVYAMEHLEDQGTLLGTFVYDQDGDSLQTFKLSDLDKGAFRFVRLQVESNWGHPDYTCLYNFRVHGKLAA